MDRDETETVIDNRLMTDEEWEEECTRLAAVRAVRVAERREAQKARNRAAFARDLAAREATN